MRRAAFFLAALALAAPAAAEERAARAAEMLERAQALLASAASDEERRAAIGRAAQAREAMLAALRDALRAGADRRAEIETELEAEHERLAAALSALIGLARAPRLAAVAHPDGALAAARAAGALSDALPPLEAEAAALSAKLTELRRLEAEAKAASDEARAGLTALSDARAMLAATAGAAADPAVAAEAARLAAAAGSLRALAARLEGAGGGPAQAPFAAATGLTPPVEGRLTRRFGERGAEGVEIEAPAWAAVYAPWRSVVRFAGPFRGEGVVTILEPEPETLIVLSGLASASVAAGETVLAGEPVGAMGGPPPEAEEFLIAARGDVETFPSAALYMEVRRGGAPADPAKYFAFGPEEGAAE